MPTTILIPLLAGSHWGVIKIGIDYENRQASVLFDDPYGEVGLIHSFEGNIMPIIRENVEFLIKQETGDDGFVLAEDKITPDDNAKTFNQQGRNTNSWDCGAIAFCNLEDYVSSAIKGVDVQYTIPTYDDELHKQQIDLARAKHVRSYHTVEGTYSAYVEERLKKAKELLERKSQEQKAKLQKLSEHYHSKLNAAEISMLFTVLDNKRLFEGENITGAYTESELKYAYEFVLGYSNNYHNKLQE